MSGQDLPKTTKNRPQKSARNAQEQPKQSKSPPEPPQTRKIGPNLQTQLLYASRLPNTRKTSNQQPTASNKQQNKQQTANNKPSNPTDSNQTST